jgi:glycosyltransferase involved in cell wall biosynthesis
MSLLDSGTSSDPEIVLDIVGDGPERSRLETQARELGLTERVCFRGPLDRPTVEKALWDAHAFVLPSLHETFGVVILEAMATELPVIATRCGGPEDIVTSETGRLVPPDDPSALAEALRAVQHNWSTYNPSKIRAYVQNEYGPDAFVRRTRSLYKSLQTAPGA